MDCLLSFTNEQTRVWEKKQTKKNIQNACFSVIIPQVYINVSGKEKEERNIDRAWQEEFRRTSTYRKLQAVENDHMVMKQKYRTVA